MKPQPLISILICTRDRAPHLRATLDALEAIVYPADLPCELIVVDNASKDETAQVVAEAGQKSKNAEVRYVQETRPGVSHARNAAMNAARGELILFTDDDVRPDANWLAGMSTPLLNGEADAVAGGVRLAPHLERDWMTTTHREFYACSRAYSGRPGALVCANMSVHKRVLEKVPAFDEELGPGRMGFGEDTLFAFQLIEAGYRLHGAWDVQVEHHFDESRLTRQALKKRSLQAGSTNSYLWHHWIHADMSVPRVRLALSRVKILLTQLRHKGQVEPEGCSLQEAQLWEKAGFYNQYLIERSRPRNYALRGLKKLHS